METISYPSPHPLCFIATPTGSSAAASLLARILERENRSPIVAFSGSGGFREAAMYERLLLADAVIADLTMAHANILYCAGVRRGNPEKTTLLICADAYIDRLPFDLAVLHVVTYAAEPDGTLTPSSSDRLETAVCVWLNNWQDHTPGHPVMPLSDIRPYNRAPHEKTDVFLQNLSDYAPFGERLRDALSMDKEEAARALLAIEEEMLPDAPQLAQLHTSLLALYLVYRETKAYDRMEALFERFPPELKRTPVAVEQRALALNRLAEGSAHEKAFDDARAYRKRALEALDHMAPSIWTSETYAIAGRIYKGQADLADRINDEACVDKALQNAIEAYETGFRQDPRDFYPGVNAVTLKLRRAAPEDLKTVAVLIPVVRFAVERAAAPENREESYWQEATRLELATAAHDWEAAGASLDRLLQMNVPPWMRETTINNLAIQQKAFAGDASVTAELDRVVQAMKG